MNYDKEKVVCMRMSDWSQFISIWNVIELLRLSGESFKGRTECVYHSYLRKAEISTSYSGRDFEWMSIYGLKNIARGH